MTDVYTVTDDTCGGCVFYASATGQDRPEGETPSTCTCRIDALVGAGTEDEKDLRQLQTHARMAKLGRTSALSDAGRLLEDVKENIEMSRRVYAIKNREAYEAWKRVKDLEDVAEKLRDKIRHCSQETQKEVDYKQALAEARAERTSK